MARVPLIDADGAEAEAAEMLERIAGLRGSAYNVYRALANSPGTLRHVYGLASFLWNETSLDSDLSELVILRVAQLSGSEYEWRRHLSLAAAAGVGDEQITALAQWRSSDPHLFTPAQRAALGVADELTRQTEVGPAAFSLAKDELGDRGMVELLVLAGFYGMVARILLSLAVDPEAGDDDIPLSSINSKMQNMHYVRIVTDAQGETHFADVRLPVEESRSSVSSARNELSDPIATGSTRFRRVVSDHPDLPHTAPRRQLVVHLRGEAEVSVSDGEARRFGPGSVVMVEDLIGKGHTTRPVGETPRETLMVELEDEQPGA